MYHYKAPHDGVTRFSVNGLKHIDKLGKLISIEAYTVGAIVKLYAQGKHDVIENTWNNNMVRIIVKGENGSCTFGGFLWGYSGEGPHGLRDLFIKCGMTKEFADHYAFSNTLGTNDATEKNTKLYNAKTLWKFMNSDIGWNLIKNEKQVPIKFKKGQKLLCSLPNNPYCIFKRYFNKDYAHVAIVYNGDPDFWITVPINSLSLINE